MPFPKRMSTFEKDMNAEIQLQAAYATIAQLRDQTDSLNRGDLKRFYENQMEALRSDRQRLIDEAVSRVPCHQDLRGADCEAHGGT